MTTTSRASRRAILCALPLGTAALWMGAPALAQSRAFRFIVVNDLHHATPECDPFFRSLVAQIRGHATIDCCLIVGDLADTGRPESFAAIRQIFSALEVPVYTVPGNHDNDVEKNTSVYARFFPGRLNYTFSHKGWQFIGLDSTDANKSQAANVGTTALAWLTDTVRSLDRRRPTVVFTHFPLAGDVALAAANAGEVLERLAPLNVRGVFTGHYHARIERQFKDAPLLTNACCSRVRDNHDGSLPEGYLLCSAGTDGRLDWEFVEFTAARKATG